MNNDAGWSGSGGPWIKPEQAMQKLVWTETVVEGPRQLHVLLSQPSKQPWLSGDWSVDSRFRNIHRSNMWQCRLRALAVTFVTEKCEFGSHRT